MAAGVDMDMVGEVFLKNAKRSVLDKKLSTAQIDAACRRILEAKYKLGLFDDPYRYVNESRPAQVMMTAEKLQASKEAAQKKYGAFKKCK